MFGFFAPTIVRVAVGMLFIYAGLTHWKKRDALADIKFPIIGKGAWIVWGSILFHVAVGAMLVFGYYTQIAALLGAVGALKGLLLGSRYKEVFVFTRSTYLLIIAVCLSLLLSGAGAFAFDIPL